MERFIWSIVVGHSDLVQVRRAQHALAAQVLAALPDAVSVLITTQGGVSLLDVAGEALDLSTVPLVLLLDVAGVYDLGMHDLQRPLIREAYRKRAAPAR